MADATLWYGDSGVDLEAADLSAEKLEQRIELLPGVSRVSVLSTGTAAEWKITLLAADTDDQRDYRPFRLVTANGGGSRAPRTAGDLQADRPPETAEVAIYLAGDWQESAELRFGTDADAGVEINRGMSASEVAAAIELLDGIDEAVVIGSGTSSDPWQVMKVSGDADLAQLQTVLRIQAINTVARPAAIGLPATVAVPVGVDRVDFTWNSSATIVDLDLNSGRTAEQIQQEIQVYHFGEAQVHSVATAQIIATAPHGFAPDQIVEYTLRADRPDHPGSEANGTCVWRTLPCRTRYKFLLGLRVATDQLVRRQIDGPDFGFHS